MDTLLDDYYETNRRHTKVVVFQHNNCERLMCELAHLATEAGFSIETLSDYVSQFRTGGTAALLGGLFHSWWCEEKRSTLSTAFNGFMVNMASGYVRAVQASVKDLDIPVVVVCGLLLNGTDDVDTMIFKIELNRHLKDLVEPICDLNFFDFTETLLADMWSLGSTQVFCAAHPMSYLGVTLFSWRCEVGRFIEKLMEDINGRTYCSYAAELDLLHVIEATIPNRHIENTLHCPHHVY